MVPLAFMILYEKTDLDLLKLCQYKFHLQDGYGRAHTTIVLDNCIFLLLI